MSSGVDQIKLSGNAAKTVEERDIPWSQQVDEASYENLSATNIEDISGTSQTNMKFQNPPFNVKENQNLSWNSFKNKKSIGNLDLNKKHGKTLYQSSLKRDEVQPNAWNLHNSNRSLGDDFSGRIVRANRQEELSTVNLDNRTIIENTSDTKKIPIPIPNGAQKKTTWASIASQPAKNVSKMNLLSSNQKKKGPGMPPPPMVPGKHDLDTNAWDAPNNNPPPVPTPPITIDISFTDNKIETEICSSAQNIGYCNDKEHKVNDYIKEENRLTYNNSGLGGQRSSPNGHSRKSWNVQPTMTGQHRQSSFGVSGHSKRNELNRKIQYNSPRTENETSLEYRNENNPRNEEIVPNMTETVSDSSQAVLDELRDKNNYNPPELDLDIAKSARFFVIKSYSEDDIHRSIKYEIWCSTDHGNKRLDDAFKERKKEGGNILLFFSVNGSGHFCGVAQMITAVDYNSTSTVWSQDKWKGKFKVKWIYVKDVPNGKLRHIRLENNENKAVTNSRDTQEVPNAKGIEVLQILHSYKHATSIFDDFYHYEKKQEEEVSSKRPSASENSNVIQNQFPIPRNFHKQQDEWNRDRESRSSTKYIGGSYRERQRSSYTHSFNDYRENAEKPGRYSQKPEGSFRRDHIRLISKQGNRERDLSEDINNTETRFLSG